jgi:hypothetical protein
VAALVSLIVSHFATSRGTIQLRPVDAAAIGYAEFTGLTRAA